jgi:alcohol dehydrogenase class IV
MEYVWDHPKVRPVVNELPYLVAVPTTSGTGSEVGRSSVVSDDTTHVKRVVFSPKLLARVVFADPELTFDLPPAVTAATGMDALTHNIESFLSPAYHPLCDGIALEGVRIGARALAAAVRNGRDLPARADMMMSSMMGAIAFQKDLGAVHSCAHALGAICDLHHGLANALMLEPVMRFNLDAAEGKFAELAHVVGAKGPADFIRWLTDLKRGIGIAPSLSAVGVKKEQIAPMVDIAEKDICHQTNPRPCTRADFARFFEQAL